MEDEDGTPSDGLEASEDLEDDGLGDANNSLRITRNFAAPGEDVIRANAC